MTDNEWADVHSTCLIYKCQNNFAPFNNISESHNYNTKSGTRGYIKWLRNNQLMGTFKYNGLT